MDEVIYTKNYLRIEETLAYDMHWEVIKASETHALCRQHILVEDIITLIETRKLDTEGIIKMLVEIADKINTEVGYNEKLEMGSPITPQ